MHIYTHIQRDSTYIDKLKNTHQPSIIPEFQNSKRSIFNWEICFNDYFCHGIYISSQKILSAPWTVCKNNLFLYRQVTLILKLTEYLLNFTHWAQFQKCILDYNKYCYALVRRKLTTKYLWSSNCNQDSTMSSKNWGHFKRERC